MARKRRILHRRNDAVQNLPLTLYPSKLRVSTSIQAPRRFGRSSTVLSRRIPGMISMQALQECSRESHSMVMIRSVLVHVNTKRSDDIHCGQGRFSCLGLTWVLPNTVAVGCDVLLVWTWPAGGEDEKRDSAGKGTGLSRGQHTTAALWYGAWQWELNNVSAGLRQSGPPSPGTMFCCLGSNRPRGTMLRPQF